MTLPVLAYLCFNDGNIDSNRFARPNRFD